MDLVFDTLANLMCIGFILFGLYHEYRWRMLFKRGVKGRGVIVDLIEKNDCDCPKVKYLCENEEKYFVSRYGGGNLDEEVTIIYNPANGDAEIYRVDFRLLLTIAPILIGGIGLYLMLFG